MKGRVRLFIVFTFAKHFEKYENRNCMLSTFGGSGVLATELGKSVSTKGHQVHFIAYQQPVRLNGFIPNIFYHESAGSDPSTV